VRLSETTFHETGYSALQRGADGQLTFCIQPGESLFLVVVATPSVQKQIVWDQPYNTIFRYPWTVQLAGAWPEAGLSILMNGFSMSGSAKAASSFYPLGFFEPSQSISGSASLVGDIEYRGAGSNKSSGTYFGFVDPGTPAAGNTTDVTVPPPYLFRP